MHQPKIGQRVTIRHSCRTWPGLRGQKAVVVALGEWRKRVIVAVEFEEIEYAVFLDDLDVASVRGYRASQERRRKERLKKC